MLMQPTVKVNDLQIFTHYFSVLVNLQKALPSTQVKFKKWRACYNLSNIKFFARNIPENITHLKL